MMKLKIYNHEEYPLEYMTFKLWKDEIRNKKNSEKIIKRLLKMEAKDIENKEMRWIY